MGSSRLSATNLQEATTIIKGKDRILSKNSFGASHLRNACDKFAAKAKTLRACFRFARTITRNLTTNILTRRLPNVDHTLTKALGTRLANKKPTSSVTTLINRDRSNIIRHKKGIGRTHKGIFTTLNLRSFELIIVTTRAGFHGSILTKFKLLSFFEDKGDNNQDFDSKDKDYHFRELFNNFINSFFTDRDGTVLGFELTSCFFLTYTPAIFFLPLQIQTFMQMH